VDATSFGGIVLPTARLSPRVSSLGIPVPAPILSPAELSRRFPFRSDPRNLPCCPPVPRRNRSRRRTAPARAAVPPRPTANAPARAPRPRPAQCRRARTDSDRVSSFFLGSAFFWRNRERNRLRLIKKCKKLQKCNPCRMTR
jgi:hypothetical protein